MPPSKLPKCDNCKKSITKRSPGLECSKCGIIVHAVNECAGLTAKQIAALRATDNLEWTCNGCHLNTPQRRSFIVPDEDEQEEEDELDTNTPKPTAKSIASIDIKKLLQDIAKDVEKTIRRQLGELQQAVDYCSAKVDEFAEDAEDTKTRMKVLEKKNESLMNTNKHLENKIYAMEQRYNELEQKQLEYHLEIAGIPYQEEENVLKITQEIAKKIGMDETMIKSVKRQRKGDKSDSVVRVELKEESEPTSWVQAARSAGLTAADLVPAAAAAAAPTPDEHSKRRVYVRHALTAYNKTLLYKTKEQLKDKFKFIWCNYEGKVMVRKAEKSKIQVVRFEDDLQKLLA
ncbi:hypothetical protein JYU34_009159 [Plutella xylostella]|uniref:Uncharacterized protein n=1 Tax=Plutella xylostella TaxID=51655 RepID=A0ABQ7QN94_PLUXY|nr:hypothetical protein JYU34_009159 [Plutella xylostella]